MPSILRDAKWTEIPNRLTKEGAEVGPAFDRDAKNAGIWVLRVRRHQSLGRSHLPQRISALKNLKKILDRMFWSESCRKQAVIVLRDEVEGELDALQKLFAFIQKEDPHVDELLRLLKKSGYKSKAMETIEGGRVYTSLSGHRIREKLNPWREMDNLASSDSMFPVQFARWVKQNKDDPNVRGASTWERLGEYFLRRYDRDPSAIVDKYFTEERQVLSALDFEGTVFSRTKQETDASNTVLGMRGKALAFYALNRTGGGTLEMKRYVPGEHAGNVPYQTLYHTTSVMRSGCRWPYSENKGKGEGRKFGSQNAELQWAHIYVLRSETFYVASASDEHSMPSAGGSVEAAGMIVVDAGKILAIDNKSGHYTPSWRLLRQAVQKIANRGAFAQGGLVGIVYQFEDRDKIPVTSAAYIPWLDFLRLCHTLSSPNRAKRLWNEMSRQWGTGFPEFPVVQKYGHVFGIYRRIWTNNQLTWEKMGEDLVNYLSVKG